MIIHVSNERTIERAFKQVNREYDHNLRMRRLPTFIGNDRQGRKKYRCTLTVHDSSGAGARIGWNGRRVAAACYHAHGDFFEALFTLEPNVRIETSRITIDEYDDIWSTDWNIGSATDPMLYSTACRCGG